MGVGERMTTAGNVATVLVGRIIDALDAQKDLLEQLVKVQTDRSRNAIREGVVPSTIAVTTAHKEVLQANQRRRGSQWCNTGTTPVTLCLGTKCNHLEGGYVLMTQGATWDGRVSGAVWTGSVNVIGAAAGTLSYSEF